MNNAIYLIRDKRSESRISSLIQKYNLELCYDEKNEQVLKNENMLLLLKKKYAFLKVISEDNRLISEIHQRLRV